MPSNIYNYLVFTVWIDKGILDLHAVLSRRIRPLSGKSIWAIYLYHAEIAFQSGYHSNPLSCLRRGYVPLDSGKRQDKSSGSNGQSDLFCACLRCGGSAPHDMGDFFIFRIKPQKPLTISISLDKIIYFQIDKPLWHNHCLSRKQNVDMIL